MTYITPILSCEWAGGCGEPLSTCLWYDEGLNMCFRHFHQLDRWSVLQSLTLTQQIMPVCFLRSSSDLNPAAYGYKSAIYKLRTMRQLTKGSIERVNVVTLMNHFTKHLFIKFHCYRWDIPKAD